MKTIYIVGGNGFARECYLNIKEIMKYDKEIAFGGFLGHNGYGDSVDYKTYQNLYIGDVSEHEFKENEYAIIGAGYPELRKKIYDDLKARNIKFYNLISPNTVIGDSVTIGESNIILSSSLTADINIGNGNLLNGEIIVGHDVKIGNFNFFGPRTQLLGDTEIGDSNTFGASSIILPKVKMGNNNKVSPLSAVYKGCKNNCYLHGNPALKMGNVE